MNSRVLLLMPTTSYRATDFLEAAQRLGAEVVVGTDRRQALEGEAPGGSLAVDFGNPARGTKQIVAFARERPLRAVIGVDDETLVLAAVASEALGLRTNPAAAVRASRDKYRARRRLAAAGLRTPGFVNVGLDARSEEAARTVRYPCVLKPRFLSAGRGVLRADDPAGFVAAFRRLAALLGRPEVARRGGERARTILVEDYLPGAEVAVEGLLESGHLRVLALFDKPDALVGPTFEETIFVTPSRLPEMQCRAILDETAAACKALGLRDGPIHAELRLPPAGPTVLEVAGRTIGGLCARSLRFGAGVSLEELVLRHALDMDAGASSREPLAAGVMMIPIPAAGVLHSVQGVAAAKQVEGIEDVTISLHRGAELVPLPEGNRYLGFIFARCATPVEVEDALRRAHGLLRVEIEPARA